MYKWFIIFLFLLFSAIVIYVTPRTPPKGDEIHYLLVTHSLVYDHDLAVGNNYQRGDYHLWYLGQIDSHAVTGRDGKQYMIHGTGLMPFLFAIPYFLAGRLGVHLFLVFVFILLIDQMYKYCLELGVNKKIAIAVLIVFSLTAPLAYYSFFIFPETLGALLTLYALRHKKSSVAGLLPWIHLRFLPITIVLFFTRTKRARLLTIVFTLLYFGFYWFIFGTVNPSVVYAKFGEEAVGGNFLHHIILVLTDSQYGLLFYSPIYIFAFAGLTKIKDKKRVLTTLVIIIAYCIPVFRFHDWNGGYSPPTRYLACLVPLIIPAAALYLDRHRNFFVRIIFVILAAWSLFAAFVNLFLTKDFGFVYTNGFSEVLNRAWSIVHFNIYKFAPLYYPYQILTTMHIVWFVIAIIIIFFLAVI